MRDTPKVRLPSDDNGTEIFCPKAGLSWPDLSRCHEIVLGWFPGAFLRLLVGGQST